MFVYKYSGIYGNSSGTARIPCVKKNKDKTGISQMEAYPQCPLQPFFLQNSMKQSLVQTFPINSIEALLGR